MRCALAVSAAVLLLAGGALAQERDDWDQIGMGRALFLANCVPCHGALAQGTSAATDGISGDRLDLTRIAERHGEFDDVEVFQIVYGVHEGSTREMPVWGRFIARHRSRGDGWARANCASLAAYLKYIQDNPPVLVAEKEK